MTAFLIPTQGSAAAETPSAAPGGWGAVRPGIRGLLRAKAGAALALSLFGYARLGFPWPLFAALFLAPDLSMLGYLAGPRTGARAYNAVHTYLAPAALAAAAGLLDRTALLAPALIWSAHIGFDRLFGYGLKHPEAFSRTHLGALGRPYAAAGAEAARGGDAADPSAPQPTRRSRPAQ